MIRIISHSSIWRSALKYCPLDGFIEASSETTNNSDSVIILKNADLLCRGLHQSGQSGNCLRAESVVGSGNSTFCKKRG